jgi:hypothetical protein
MAMIPLEETRYKYKNRIEDARTLGKNLITKFKANQHCEIEDLDCTYSFKVGDSSCSIFWNIPYQLELRVDQYSYGADYIKSDEDWRETCEEIGLILEKLSIGEFNKVEYLKGSDHRGGYIRMNLGGRSIVLRDPRTPLITLHLKKKTSDRR